jgi:aminoacrylate hydrolase
MPKAAGLWYEWHGPPEAEIVMLSAGLGGSASYWTPNLAALTERYRVLLYDHRGTGRSDRNLPAALTVDHMAADLLGLIAALDLPPAHFVGHAAGAAIGLTLALEAPQRLRSLVAVNGWASLDPHFARCFEARLMLLLHGGPRAYLRAQPIFLYPAAWVSEHSARLDAETEEQLHHFPGADSLERRIAALQSFYVEDRLGEIETPLLALAAADDMLVPWTCSRRLADAVRNGSLEVMEWGGHACNLTDPGKFDRILLAWLAGGAGAQQGVS